MEIGVLFIPRRQALGQGGEEHVEVELVQPRLVLRPGHGTDTHLDAQSRQVGSPGQQDALQAGVDQQYLEYQWPPGTVLQPSIVQSPPRLVEQGYGAAQGLSGDTTTIGDRESEGLQEELRWQLVPERLEKQEFLACGQAGGAERAVREVAQRALIGIVEQHPVGPLEIEQHAQRLTHRTLIEGAAPGIEEQALGRGGNLVLDCPLQHRAGMHCGKIIGVGPVAGLVVEVDVELAGLEGFEGDVVVPVELDLHPVKVVLAAVDRQVPAPVILHPLEHQPPPGGHLGDAVGAAVERRFEGGVAEAAVPPVVFGQNRQLTQPENEQRVVRLPENEADAVAAEDVDALDFLQHGAVVGVTLFAQQPITEGYVVCRDCPTVMKASLGSEVEYYPAAVVRELQTFGDQTIGRVRFVAGGVVDAAADHQWLVQL